MGIYDQPAPDPANAANWTPAEKYRAWKLGIKGIAPEGPASITDQDEPEPQEPELPSAETLAQAYAAHRQHGIGTNLTNGTKAGWRIGFGHGTHLEQQDK